LQSTTPPAYLGRVSGVARAISFGLEPLSSAMIGALSRAISGAAALLIGGAAATSADLYAFTRGLRKDRADHQQRPSGSVDHSPGAEPFVTEPH
jgi:DHA3 family macrolide efflux protein-like MFS transporter